MHTTASLLDACRKHYGLPSDNALAIKWGVTRSRVGHWRTGVNTFSDDKALEIADLLSLDGAQVLISIQAERAAKTHNQALFSTLQGALKRLGGVAATVCFLALFLPSHQAEAAPLNTQTAYSECILCQIIGRC